MLSLILLKKIVSLYLILIAGAALVRSGLLKADDSKTLSIVCMYLVAPCSILAAIRIDKTTELMSGLMLSLIGAALIITVYIFLAHALRRPLKLTNEEEISVSFPNVGNLVIPLVQAVLGQEWVVFTLGFIIVQTVLIWTYAKTVLSGDSKPEWKKILLNPNIIAIGIAAVIFVFDIRLPDIAEDAIGSVSGLVGPLGMLITGMIIGGMSLKSVFSDKRIWCIAGIRLLALPLIALVLLKFLPLAGMNVNGKTILLITLIGAASPSMATVTQMASIYGGDRDHACAINVLSTLLCVATMPLIILLYQL